MSATRQYAVIQLGYTTFSDAFDSSELAIADANDNFEEPMTEIPSYIPGGRGTVDGAICMINSDDEIWANYVRPDGHANV